MVILKKIVVIAIILFSLTAVCSVSVFAVDIVAPAIDVTVGSTDDPAEVVSSLQLLILLSIISLAPSLLVTLTSFTRIIICLHFLRSALGTQQMPPNQVLITLALVMTLFIMGPVFTSINEDAIQPFANGDINQQQAIEYGMEPLRDYMLSQVRDNDLELFASLSGETYSVENPIPNSVLIPAYMLSELYFGFFFGFFIYLPFIIIDMVIASILMSMGMMMLPPAMISLPFKILLFVMIDGWSLTVESIIKTFRLMY